MKEGEETPTPSPPEERTKGKRRNGRKRGADTEAYWPPPLIQTGEPFQQPSLLLQLSNYQLHFVLGSRGPLEFSFMMGLSPLWSLPGTTLSLLECPFEATKPTNRGFFFLQRNSSHDKKKKKKVYLF